MTEPKPTYTAEDMGVNCPACGVAITTGNAGGYRTYCDGCVDKVTALIQAQAAIVAMLKECGLSQVRIHVDEKYNLFHRRNSIVGYQFRNLSELYEQKQPPPRFKQAALLEDE